MMEMVVLVFGGGIMIGMAIDFVVNFNTTSWPASVTNIWNNVPMLAILIFVVLLLVLVRKIV